MHSKLSLTTADTHIIHFHFPPFHVCHYRSPMHVMAISCSHTCMHMLPVGDTMLKERHELQAGHNPGVAGGMHNFGRTSSIELGDIYRTASAISMFLEEADARPFINRLMSMPAMNSDGLSNRPVIDASTINPNIEVRPPLLMPMCTCCTSWAAQHIMESRPQKCSLFFSSSHGALLDVIQAG